METVVSSKRYADFITITCLNWIPLLQEDRFKDIIIESLSFLCRSNRVSVYAFVIMSNHMHLIWQIIGENERQDVQRDFLKFTGQQILKILRNEKSSVQEELLVNAKDRKLQVWERNSLSIPLWSDNVMWQKLEYIHRNPVKARLCKHPEEYKYSSASFYFNREKRWNFLIHCDG
jgi:putative transposase